jgi:hypothetical protein
VAKIVLHGDDDVDITDFVDNGGGYEGNDSDKGNESDDDDKKDDGYNNATKEVIFDCAAGTQCKAPPSANLADSPHSCWGCNKKIHSSLLCGESILNLLSSNYPSYIGRSMSNGRLIQEDDNNETRALCFKCIALLLEARKFEEAQKLNARMSDMLAVPPLTARMEASPQKLEARSVPPMTRREDFLGQLKCDWLSQSCVRKTETPDTCTQCNRPVHFQFQLSWERYADLSHEKKCTSQVCPQHHPEYQHWRELHIKPVAVHEKEAREKEALNSFVWAREGEHEGANYHQCQVLDRIAEKGQVWVKWTSTVNIMCIPTSNIEEPTQGRDRKRSMVCNVEKNPKKQRKEIATGNALSPVLLLTDTPPTPPYSRKTRSSGAKRDDGKSAIWIKACVQAVKNEDSC